jgi:hypothetical protein
MTPRAGWSAVKQAAKLAKSSLLSPNYFNQLDMSVTAHADIAAHFTKIRTRKERYMVMNLNEEGTEVSLTKFGERSEDFANFAACFTADQPALGVIDFEFEEDGRSQSKIIYVRYTPDACTKTQLKFQYANASDFVKAKCNPINKELQINDLADMTFEYFKGEL